MSRRSRAAILLIVSFGADDALALDPDKLPSQYVHESWDMDDGLPMNTVSSVDVDLDGFLWFTTEDGSGWFDGERFVYRNGRTTPELTSRFVDVVPLAGGEACHLLAGERMVCVAPDGRARVMDDDGLSERTTGEIGPRNTKAARDGDGRIWIADDLSGLLRLENGRLTRIVDRPVRSVAAAPGGGVWAGAAGALVRVRDGTVEETPLPEGRREFVTFVSAGRDVVWFVAGRLHALRDGKVTAVELPGILAAPSAVLEDRDGNVWIGTTAGLLRLRAGVLSQFPADHPLANVYVYDLAEDRQGSMWIATAPTGLHRLQSGSFTTVGVPEGLRHPTVWTLAEERDGTILVGGEGGVHRHRRGKVVEVFGRREGLPADMVRDLAVETDGTIWAASIERSKLGRIRGRRAETVDLSAAFPERGAPNELAKLAVDGSGDLWVGALGPLVVQLRDGKPVRTWSEEDGLPPRTELLGTLRDGTVWAAGEGVSFLRADGSVSMKPPAALRDSAEGIGQIVEDGDRFWVPTQNGIAVVEAGRWRPVTSLPDERLQSLVDDGLGYLWGATNVGIFRFNRQEALASLESGAAVAVRWFGREDGMRTPECDGPRHSALRAADGRLWFATASGAVWVDPARIESNAIAPAVRIVETRVDGKRIDPARLAAGTRRFEIDYTASVLRSPKKARFRYRLEGLDPGWIDAGNRRTAYYTNVPPGSYRFQVTAANEDGVWNEAGASMQIRIAPYFRETRAFLVLSVLGIAGVVVGGFRVRSRQLRARAKELERQVEEATKLLAARMDEKLARTGQVARFGEFAASVAHNLKTPLTFLRGEIELLDEKRRSGKMSDAELETALRVQLEHVRRMNEEIETGMSFVRPGAAPVVDVDLAALAREIALLLRSRADASKVKIEIGIDELCARGNLDNLRHAIANLVSNAIEAMPGGGTITISGRRIDGFAELRVADDGPGIPDSVRAKLFRPFVSTKGEQGTGLGLASCRRIIEEEHGGKIRLEPSGSGATFVLDLPL